MKQSTINYYDAVQCKDKITGKIGDFLHNGDFCAVSPIFDNLIDFFKWTKINCVIVGYVDDNPYKPIYNLTGV